MEQIFPSIDTHRKKRVELGVLIEPTTSACYGSVRPGAGIGVMSKRTLNVELTGPRRQTAMSARSNLGQGVARAWTAAVGVPVEQRHVKRHFVLRGPS